MINEAPDSELRTALNNFLRNINIEQLERRKDLKGQSLDEFQIGEEDFQTIKIQLRALGLIAKSVEPLSNSG